MNGVAFSHRPRSPCGKDIKGRLLMPAHSNWLMMSLVSGNVCAMGPLGSRHISFVCASDLWSTISKEFNRCAEKVRWPVLKWARMWCRD